MAKKKFIVAVCKNVRTHAFVRVEAESTAKAEKIAIEQAKEGKIDWLEVEGQESCYDAKGCPED